MKRYTLSILTFMVSGQLFAQTGNISTPDPITLPVHKNNRGKVIFTADTIPVEKLKEADFLKNYTANNTNNLM